MMNSNSQIQMNKQNILNSWSFIEPKSVVQTFIPKEFRNTLALHIIKNEITDLTTPLFLAIQGPKGEGKSFQTRELCSEMGIYVVPLSGAMLSGSHEKDAVNVMEKAYLFASSLKKQKRRMTILLIDDFDLSVASSFEERRYTVNTQLLNGFLMNLADDPTQCGSKSTLQIPIVLTGNNFEALHGPLTRYGRMNFFEWQPSLEHKISIVTSIFERDISPNQRRKFEHFVKMYANQPISFFVTLKSDMVDGIILKTIAKQGVDINLIQRIILNMPKIDIKTLHALADKRQSNGQPKNYLSEMSSVIKGYLPGGRL